MKEGNDYAVVGCDGWVANQLNISFVAARASDFRARAATYQRAWKSILLIYDERVLRSAAILAKEKVVCEIERT